MATRQLYRSRKAAEIASKAAEETQAALEHSISLVNLSLVSGDIKRAQHMIYHKEYENARFLVTEHHSQLIQLRHLGTFSSSKRAKEIQSVITQLKLVKEELNKKVWNIEYNFNITEVHTRLAEVSAQLNDWIGEEKYLLEGEENDSK